MNLSFLEHHLFYQAPVSAENRYALSAKPEKEKGCVPVFYKEAENVATRVKMESKYFKIISTINMTLHEQSFKTESWKNFVSLNI